jgi:GTPase
LSNPPTTDPVSGQGLTRAVLVGVDIGGQARFDDTLDELALLAESAGDLTVGRVIARRRAPDPALFVGSGRNQGLGGRHAGPWRHL